MRSLEETKKGSIANFKMMVFYKFIGILALMFKNYLLAKKLSDYYGLQIYSQAFFILTMIVDIIGAGLVLALVPTLVKARVREGKKRSVDLTNNILHIMMVFSFIVIVVNFFLAGKLARSFGSSLSEQGIKDLTLMIRLGTPLVFIILTRSVFLGFLQSNHKFKAGVTGAVLLNLVKIVYLLLARNVSMLGLMIASIAANAAYYLKAIPLSKASGYFYKRKLDLRDPYLRDFNSILVPMVLVSVFLSMEGNMFSYLGKLSQEGNLAIFSDGKYLVNMFSNLIIITIVTITFPVLSEFSEEERREDYLEAIKYSLKTLFVFVLPFIGLALAFSPTIVSLFSDLKDTGSLSYVLRLSSLSLIFISMNLVFYRVLYSLWMGEWVLLLVAIDTGIKYFLGKFLLASLGIKGLALSSLISSIIIFTIFIVLMKNNNVNIFKDILVSFLEPLRLSLLALIIPFILYNIFSKTSLVFTLATILYVGIYIFLYKKRLGLGINRNGN